MRIWAALALLCTIGCHPIHTAYWTGRSRDVADKPFFISCEYNDKNGHTFWRVYHVDCPATIDIE
jgi:hypothetical protein